MLEPLAYHHDQIHVFAGGGHQNWFVLHANVIAMVVVWAWIYWREWRLAQLEDEVKKLKGR